MSPLHPGAGRRLIAAAVVLLGLVLGEGGPVRSDPAIPEIEPCRQHLAGRLSLAADEVRVVRLRPVVFADSGLGLPEPGEVYLQVQTPGHAAVLEARGHYYLYTTSAASFRYGGPLNSWKYSALALEPVDGEPNLNGNLVQTSLAGTNPETLLRGVSDFRPQVDGSLLATRRTSRSGYDLLYLAPEERGEPTRLLSCFDCSEPVLDRSGKTWAAFVRSGAGRPWTLARNALGAPTDRTVQTELPVNSRPVHLFFSEQNPSIEVTISGRTRFFELVTKAGRRTWRELVNHRPPALVDLQLNKSQRLEVRPSPAGNSTLVLEVWFTGDERVVASIPAFQAREVTISPDKDFMVLSGRRRDDPRAFAVDLRTGEVLALAPGSAGETRFFSAAPRAWSTLERWIRP